MRITNRLCLPETIVRAVTPKHRPNERRENADISVTELLSPPRVKQLREAFWDELEVDASEMMWMLYGSIAHEILERNSGPELVERRLHMEVDGVKISGAFDLILEPEAERIMIDYKMVKVWSFIMGRQEWEEQMNLYRLLLIENGERDVDKLTNVLLLKDWNAKDVERIDGYPTDNVAMVDQPLWPVARIRAFAAGRVAEHRVKMPECNPLERIHKADTWAVRKEGALRVTRVFDAEYGARMYAQEMNSKGKGAYSVELRPGEDVRCLKFCPVWQYCDHGRRVHGAPEIEAEP